MSLRVDVDFHVDRLIAEIEARQPAALAAAMEVVRAKAVEYTPVEWGRLAGSADVDVDGDTATLSYDGPYARYQHERLDLRHETGKAKYLELAMIEKRGDAMDALAKGLRGGS